MTRDELLALPATVDLPTAGRALELSRQTAYDLARNDLFPVRVIKIGRLYKVPTADLLKLLGIEPSDADVKEAS